MKVRGRQSGIALLTALVLLALCTVIAAALAFAAGFAIRRAEGTSAFEQAVQAAGGAEAVAAFALDQDSQGGSADDYPGEIWTQTLPPREVVTGILLAGQLNDLNGRFNLNSLVDSNGVDDPFTIDEFKRLLGLLGIEQRYADLMADWIDADNSPLPLGAEDSFYSSQPAPYRPPNLAITSISELLALPGFTSNMFATLAPHVAALPRDQQVNICFASGEVLDALLGSAQQQYSLPNNKAVLATNRGGKARKCDPEKTTFLGQYTGPPADQPKFNAQIATQSRFFSLRSIISIGSTEFALYSLLMRDKQTPGAGPATVRVITRSFTE